MKVYRKKQKEHTNVAWGYWGDFGEIDMGFSYGEAISSEIMDKLHYHKKGIVYMIVLEGKGALEINEQQVLMEKDTLIRIDPGEKYRHTHVFESPLRWITVCSVKKPEDKVVVE